MKTIQEVFDQVKPEWKFAAYQKHHAFSKQDNKWVEIYHWWLFRGKPQIIEEVTGFPEWFSMQGGVDVSILFDIEPFNGDWKNSLIEREKEEMEKLHEYLEQFRFEPITSYTVDKIRYGLNEIIPDFCFKGAVKFFRDPLQIEILYDGKIVCVLK